MNGYKYFWALIYFISIFSLSSLPAQAIPYEIVEDWIMGDDISQIIESPKEVVIVTDRYAEIWDRSNKRKRMTLELTSNEYSPDCYALLQSDQLFSICDSAKSIRVLNLTTGLHQFINRANEHPQAEVKRIYTQLKSQTQLFDEKHWSYNAAGSKLFYREEHQPFSLWAPILSNRLEHSYFHEWSFFDGENFFYFQENSDAVWRIHIPSASRTLIAKLGEDDDLMGEQQGNYLYFRDWLHGLKRLNLYTGELLDWLPGYASQDSLGWNDVFPNILYQGHLYQLVCATHCQDYDVKETKAALRVWDLESNQLKFTFSLPHYPRLGNLVGDGLKNIGVMTNPGNLLKNPAQYKSGEHLKLWDLQNGKSILEKFVGRWPNNCSNISKIDNAGRGLAINYNLQDKAIISLCDVLQAKLIQQWEHSKSLVVSAFVWNKQLLILDSKMVLWIYDQVSGKLLKHKQLFQHIPDDQEWPQVYTYQTDTHLHIYVSFVSELDSHQYGTYHFATEQFVEHDGFDTFLKQEDKGLWFNNAREVFYIPTGKSHKRDRVIVWQIKSFGENMLLINQDGQYLGFGDYQRYFHLQRDGVMIPWEDAEQSYKWRGQ